MTGWVSAGSELECRKLDSLDLKVTEDLLWLKHWTRKVLSAPWEQLSGAALSQPPVAAPAEDGAVHVQSCAEWWWVNMSDKFVGVEPCVYSDALDSDTTGNTHIYTHSHPPTHPHTRTYTCTHVHTHPHHRAAACSLFSTLRTPIRKSLQLHVSPGVTVRTDPQILTFRENVWPQGLAQGVPGRVNTGKKADHSDEGIWARTF